MTTQRVLLRSDATLDNFHLPIMLRLASTVLQVTCVLIKKFINLYSALRGITPSPNLLFVFLVLRVSHALIE